MDCDQCGLSLEDVGGCEDDAGMMVCWDCFDRGAGLFRQWDDTGHPDDEGFWG